MKAPPEEHWEIRHPGSGERVKCATFEACLRWYEGYNLPLRVVDGVPEAFQESYERMGRYHEEQYQAMKANG